VNKCHWPRTACRSQASANKDEAGRVVIARRALVSVAMRKSPLVAS
jgi:hypothetical protein